MRLTRDQKDLLPLGDSSVISCTIYKDIVGIYSQAATDACGWLTNWEIFTEGKLEGNCS